MEQEFEEGKLKLISEKDVSLIKLKLGKSHRSEADWTVIKDILLSHYVISAVPLKRDSRLKAVNGILCEKNYLFVFTNKEDCKKHLLMLNLRQGMKDRNFEMGAMPFEVAVDVAERHGMNLYIDMQAEVNAVCMYYIHGISQLKAVRLAGYRE